MKLNKVTSMAHYIVVSSPNKETVSTTRAEQARSARLGGKGEA
jgi:hypothetical protein